MTTLATAPSLLPVVEIKVVDSLDVSTLMRLSEQLEDAMSLNPQQIVVDLGDCPYIDAQALRVLTDAHRAMWVSGGRLRLRGISGDTARLLSLAGLDEVFDVDGPRR